MGLGHLICRAAKSKSYEMTKSIHLRILVSLGIEIRNLDIVS